MNNSSNSALPINNFSITNPVILTADTDGDGTINSLDTDSDDGGIDDIVDAQFDQTFIAPLGVDSDGDGLDDAFDQNLDGAAGSVGLVAADTNSDGLADFLDDNGGSDVLLSTSGDDTLTINSNAVAGLSSAPMSGVIADIDGDTGADTLALTGSNITLDLTNIDNGRINSIENIDITGDGDNTLNLDLNDLLDLSESTNQLTIFGDSGDTVNVTGGFTDTGNDQVIDGTTFDVFEVSNATLLVEQEVTVVI